jgi:hypothetical protein
LPVACCLLPVACIDAASKRYNFHDSLLPPASDEQLIAADGRSNTSTKEQFFA